MPFLLWAIGVGLTNSFDWLAKSFGLADETGYKIQR
ncbi:hypothetical protein SAMN05518861_1166 [Mesorhizobium sp. YR577]|nr:hypothetical protein SAMN05518861_1166 [Mesorhizobium sp. YR577]